MDYNRITRRLANEAMMILSRYGFKDTVPAVIVDIFESKKFNGLYYPKQNLIKINKDLIDTSPWYVVLEILKHELAHHVAHECFNAEDYTSHGAPFQRACDALNLESSARKASTSVLKLGKELEDEREKILERARKLAAMSEGSDNANEAAVALRRLQELQAKHDIEAWERDKSLEISTIFIDFGVPKRSPTYTSALGGLLMNVYKVQAIYGRQFNVKANRLHKGMEFIGTPEALEMVDYAWDFIVKKMKAAYKNYEGPRSRKAANAFYISFIEGIARNFLISEEKTKNEVTRQEEAMVLMDQEVAKKVADYYKKKYPKVSRSYRSGGQGDYRASEAGHEAGQKTNFNRGMSKGETKMISA